MWIIYAHTNKTNNKKYIGQTRQSPNQRWRGGKGYKGSTYFYHAIQKYGWQNFYHQILEENIPTQEIANEREKYWINKFQSNNSKYGYNLAEGGYVYPEQATEKMKELWQNPVFYAKFATPVICVNNGKIYKSIKEAARQTNATARGISKNCRGKQNSSGTDEETKLPLVWAFYEKGKEYKYTHPLKKSKRTKAVICLTTGKIFDSIGLANKYYGLASNDSSISRCCRNSHCAVYYQGKPLMWSYYDPNQTYEIGQKYIRSGSQAIQCIETGKIYSSIDEASRDTGIAHSNLTACCKGRIKTAQKLHWQYYHTQENNEKSNNVKI